ncbi:helix-turn-helix domain-containing protein [Streptomyces sp. NPDC005548]|uniref:helix-turn-helix domain-containing protein n=1 Tax=Streptomyces sp. NPDC005548 TaxID=3364724 RepID=UPI0036A8BBC9
MPAAASVTRHHLHSEMESAGNTLHIVLGDGREIELARSLAAAGRCTLLVTSRQVVEGDCLDVDRLPEAAPGARIVLGTVVLQVLLGALSAERNIPIKSFVFAKDDRSYGFVHDLLRAAGVVFRARGGNTGPRRPA